jgi:hypothetical protein
MVNKRLNPRNPQIPQLLCNYEKQKNIPGVFINHKDIYGIINQAGTDCFDSFL